MKLYGAEGQHSQLQALMRQPTFVHVVAGPPGSAKTTTIKHAAHEAGLQVQTVAIDHQSVAKLAETLRKLGTTVLSESKQVQETLWLVLGAEILPAAAAPYWKAGAAMGGLRIVLEVCDVPPSLRSGPGKLDVIYFNKVSEANVKAFLCDNGMTSQQAHAARATQGDLHQAALVAGGWSVDPRVGTGKDTAPHLWFDTKQLVNPGALPLSADRVDLGWVQCNAPSRYTNLGEMANFAELCTVADGFGFSEPEGGVVGDILQLGLRTSQRHRTWSARVEAPRTVKVNGVSSRKAQRRKEEEELLERKAGRDDKEPGEKKKQKRDPLPATIASSSQVDEAKRKREEEQEQVAHAKRKREEEQEQVAHAKRRELRIEAFRANHARLCEEDRAKEEEKNRKSSSTAGAAEGVEESSGSSAPPLIAAWFAAPPEPAEPAAPLVAAPAPVAAVVSDVVYDGGAQFRIVRREAATAPGPNQPEATLGEACANHAKGRPLVTARCESLDDYDMIAASPAVRGCVVGSFSNGFFALIFKHPNREFKAMATCSFSTCRISPALVRQAFELFDGTTRRGDVELEEVACGVGGIPLFEEAMEALKGASSGDLAALTANAKRAKVMKQATPLQMALLIYWREMKDEIKGREDSEAMVFDVRKKGPHFLDNFDRPKILAMRGVHCERAANGRMKIMKVSFRDAMEKPAAPGKPPLYLLKTLIWNGEAGCGKTEFVHGVARECCKRKQKDVYSCASSLCPLGIMTKSGRTKDLGAICFEDFEMRTRGGTHCLTREEKKSLLYVKQRAHYHAFYHQAILPEFVPRLWSINYGKDKKEAPSKSEWFASQGLEGLRLLVEGDEEGLNRAEEHVKAEARRAVIFCVEEQLFPENAEGATDAAGAELWGAEKENATAFD